MTQTVSAAEVQAAGGLEKWMKKAAQAPAPASPVKKKGQFDKLRNLEISPAAKGRLPSDLAVGYDVDRMNKLEARYAGYLEGQRRTGRIVFWRFEAVKFRLADLTWYTPDFYIMRTDGNIEIHETKGFWEDDARVKIKATAEQFPEFWFVAVQWKAQEWLFERFRAHGGA
jgi:hypothetical protein